MWKRPVTDGDLREQADADSSYVVSLLEDVVCADGTKIRALVTGSGQPVIFLPMVAELNFVYTPQITEFIRDHRIIVYEPRLRRRRYFGVADRAREVITLMDALQIDKAHIVAWSDTGSAAYVLARDWPERCLSASFLGLADRYRFPWHLSVGMQALSVFPLERVVPGWVLGRILAQFLGGPQVPARWVQKQAADIERLTPLFKHSVLPNLLEHRPQAGEVTVPSVVICGDCDYLVKTSQAHRMAELLPGSGKAVIIEGGEHLLPYVNGDAVNRELRAFFAGL